jgi:hypothetical protein
MATAAACASFGSLAPATEASAEAFSSPPHLLSGTAAGPTPAQPPPPITVTIDRFDPGRPVPPRFLGLSFEAAALTQISQYATRGNLVGLLRSLGPGVLRFGGITADENVAWTDAATPRPAWASQTIGPGQLYALGVLARRSGWRILLTVGLAHYEPAAAAREVATAHRALGPSLAAIEIGNEPNAYGNHGLRPLPWLAQGYEEEVSSYREAIAALTPGVPIAGPDVSGSGSFAEWGEEEALAQTPALLSGHHYPLGCAQTPAPSIETLLSAATRGRAAHSLATYLSVANAHDIPLRIDETNTVSCGGVAGISNTFASALWATGYITQAMAAGVAGINLQGNPANCRGYTPLCAPDPASLAQGRLRARPEWYALLLTRALVGDRPLPTTIVPASPSLPTGEGSPGAPAEGSPSTPAPSSPNLPVEGSPETPPPGTPDLVAASFLAPDHSLRVVLVNDEPPGTRPLALRLHVGAGMESAGVERLTAPAPSAEGGVLLAGRAVAPDGSWRAPARTMTTAVNAGTVTLDLPPSSAALVMVSRPKPARAGAARVPAGRVAASRRPGVPRPPQGE